jgi:two-component system, NarL family, sensor histidine kinase BarA
MTKGRTVSVSQGETLRDRRVAYAITDRCLRVTEVGGANEILANGHGAWQGRSLLDFAPELAGCEEALQEILRGNLPLLEITWVDRDLPGGHSVYRTLIDLPHRDEAGAITGVIHMVQDVTQTGELAEQYDRLAAMERALREQNTQLLAANAELKRLDEAKSAFVAIAAQELRSPLASISGYIEMLLDGDAGQLNAKQTEYVAIVEASAARLLELSRNLLDFVRLESGCLDLLLQPIDLRGLVAGVIAERRPQTEARGQRVELVAADALPPALADRGRAAQIVGNLVSNASKFSPAATPIRVLLEPAAGPAGYVQVTVEDAGPGIALEEQARLFQPFARGSGPLQSGQPGSGLGLYITKSLVELHGGQISLVSTPGCGTRVSLTLPQAETLPTTG